MIFCAILVVAGVAMYAALALPTVVAGFIWGGILLAIYYGPSF